MNKLTDFQKRMIVLGMGLLIMLFGAVQAIFEFEIFIKYKRMVDDVTFILMVLAAGLLFSIKKPRPEPETPSEAKEAEKIEETTGVQMKDPN